MSRKYQSIGAPCSGAEPFCRSAVGEPLREAGPERCRSAAPGGGQSANTLGTTGQKSYFGWDLWRHPEIRSTGRPIIDPLGRQKKSPEDNYVALFAHVIQLIFKPRKQAGYN